MVKSPHAAVKSSPSKNKAGGGGGGLTAGSKTGLAKKGSSHRPGTGTASTVPNTAETAPPSTPNNPVPELIEMNVQKPIVEDTSTTKFAQRPPTASSSGKKLKKKRSHGRGRFIIKNLWEVCCNEVETEKKDLDHILKNIGLPSIHFNKRKSYELTDYEVAPNLASCISKDFLDFYVFPTLLPGIQALVKFARVNRIFQYKYSSFNPLDFIVEYLYNNNPRYPERVQNPVPIFEIPFCKEWLEKNPREPPPTWLTMNSEDAAVIIQSAVRGFLVRCRPEIQEMRQFWRDFRQDMKEEKELEHIISKKLSQAKKASEVSPFYEEIAGEFDDMISDDPPDLTVSARSSHHSDTCVYCDTFRKFLALQPEDVLKSYEAPPVSNKQNEVVEPSNEPEGVAPDSLPEGAVDTADVDGKDKKLSVPIDARPSSARLKGKSLKSERPNTGKSKKSSKG